MEWDKLLAGNRFGEMEQEKDVTYRSDYDRIICSTLFRRLQDKAQVFPLDTDDYVRTRLTHSLEVSAIGKRLGEYVFVRLKEEGIDKWFSNHQEKEFSDVLLCAGLVHDIGNPPFGHFGEYAVREWFQAHLSQLALGKRKLVDMLSDWQIQDLYHFEGNAQSLRLLSKTPYLGGETGFNLSYSILGTIIKYPISSEKLVKCNPHHYKKTGYNFSERELFEDINEKTGMNGSRHPLSFLLEAADDIAYRTSDLEDALVKKVITFQNILEEFREYISGTSESQSGKEEAERRMMRLKELYQEEIRKNSRKPELAAVQKWNQYIQGMMIKDGGNAFVSHYSQIMSGDYKGDLFDNTPSGHIIAAVSGLSEKMIYTSSIKTRTELFGRRVIDCLLSQFIPAAAEYDTGKEISFISQRIIDTVSGFYKSMYFKEAAGKSEEEKLYLRLLMITDYISGMTDNYAKRLYQELF